MSKVNIFWDPQGLELDSLGSKKFLEASDGDTPKVSMPIRLLSIDTPETHYPGTASPRSYDGKLAQLAVWIDGGKAPVNPDLGQHLYTRLVTACSGTLQATQGRKATEIFLQILDDLLKKADGSMRSVYLQTSDQPFDDNGRLLAYMAPYYSAAELEKMATESRKTFNLLMVESGWAAPFLIYPSLPKYKDLVIFREAARQSCEERRGIWSDPLTMTGYEFRMAVKLYGVTEKLVKGESMSIREKYSWIDRYCADMTSGEIFYPQDYHLVKPFNRLFIWARDVGEAVPNLNLMPGER